MIRHNKKQSGFSIVIVMIALVVCSALAYVIYEVKLAGHPKSNAVTSKNTLSIPVSPIAKFASASPAQELKGYDGWGTSNNFLGNNFSFRLPIIGWRMSSESGQDGMSRTFIREDPGYGLSSDDAQFWINLNISNSAESARSYNGVISSGMGTSVATLHNGINIWQSNNATYDRSKDILYCSGKPNNHVVQLSAQSGDKLYVALPNGKYMTYIASFCQPTSGQKLNATFDLQATSEEMLIASKILTSIQYQPKWVYPPRN